MGVFSMNINKARHIVSINPLGLKNLLAPHIDCIGVVSLKPQPMKIGDTTHVVWIATDKKCRKIFRHA